MRNVLLDTSCIVALLDKSERFHKSCLEVVTSVNANLITCESVITESCYLLRNYSKAIEAIFKNIEAGIFQIPFNLSHYSEETIVLLKKYQNVPMDLADACLVQLANKYKTAEILTLDSDFDIYRWGNNKKFNCLLLN